MNSASVALPPVLRPQLATLASKPPVGSTNWIYEIKFDGYRLLTRVEGDSIQLFTRNGNDWTERLVPLKKAIGAFRLPEGWYDGEIVVLDDDELPNFNLLQGAFDNKRKRNIVYYLFDMPFCGGEDLRRLPVVERRERLAEVLGAGSETVRYSETLTGPIRDLVASACKLGLEGIIGKRVDSRYVSKRSDSWIKLKCSSRQEFVIGGFTDSEACKDGLGSLLLGVYDNAHQLLYAGSVGTGFNDRTLKTLRARLDSLEITERPFSRGSRIVKKGVHWVAPQLVAEVAFAEWTPSGRIRHATFRGLRDDVAAESISRVSDER